MLITEDFSLISITSFISYKLLTFTKKKTLFFYFKLYPINCIRLKLL